LHICPGKHHNQVHSCSLRVLSPITCQLLLGQQINLRTFFHCKMEPYSCYLLSFQSSITTAGKSCLRKMLTFPSFYLLRNWTKNLALPPQSTQPYTALQLWNKKIGPSFAGQTLSLGNSSQIYCWEASAMYFVDQTGMCPHMNDKGRVTKQQQHYTEMLWEHL